MWCWAKAKRAWVGMKRKGLNSSDASLPEIQKFSSIYPQSLFLCVCVFTYFNFPFCFIPPRPLLPFIRDALAEANSATCSIGFRLSNHTHGRLREGIPLPQKAVTWSRKWILMRIWMVSLWERKGDIFGSHRVALYWEGYCLDLIVRRNKYLEIEKLKGWTWQTIAAQGRNCKEFSSQSTPTGWVHSQIQHPAAKVLTDHGSISFQPWGHRAWGVTPSRMN